MSTFDRILQIRDEYARCTACGLNKYRRQSIRSAGNTTDPKVVFVLDRFDPADVTRGVILQGDQHAVLDTLLSFLKREIQEYYYIPVVACPTAYLHTIQDMVPLAKAPDVGACGKRVQAEIACLQPYVVVACGQSAVKSVLPKQTPQVATSAGSTYQMVIQGEHVAYPVPVVITNSLHTLGKLPEQEQPALWHATCEHIWSAIRVAEQLHTLEHHGE